MGQKGKDGKLVDEYKIGNTKIKIYDSAYVEKSKEDVDKIIKRIEDIGREAFYEL